MTTQDLVLLLTVSEAASASCSLLCKPLQFLQPGSLDPCLLFAFLCSLHCNLAIQSVSQRRFQELKPSFAKKMIMFLTDLPLSLCTSLSHSV